MGKKSPPVAQQPVYRTYEPQQQPAARSPAGSFPAVNKMVKKQAGQVKQIQAQVKEPVEDHASMMGRRRKQIRKSVLLSGGKGIESDANVSKQTLLGG
jgi:hypothetical protein